jgi:protein SCO1
MRARVGSYVAALAAVWVGAALGAAPAAAQNDRWGANYFPNVTLTTQDGATVRFYDGLIKGKIVAINLIYTTCKYQCPLETARLAQVYRLLGDRMGRDVFFYSITIDPEHDTPAVLKAYAETMHAGPGWLFLTGRAEDIDLISRKTGLYSPPDPASSDGHTPHLLVGNERTAQWIRNSGVDNPKFLATTIGTWLNSWQTSAAPARSYANVPKLQFAAGEYTFNNSCAACHTIGGGDRIGPDLRGVTSTRDHAWLARYIREPNAVRSSNDAIALTLSNRFKPAVMPQLGLTSGDVTEVIRYIEQQSAAGTAVPSAAQAAGPAAAAVSLSPSSATAASTDLRSILDPYVRMQRALNADSLDGVAASVRDLSAQAMRAGPDFESIRSAAAAIKVADGIGGVRAAFGRVGDEIFAYARAHPGSLTADVKVAYCPMLRAYWMQRGDTIENPFYGQRMSDCGRFVQGLPPPRTSASSPD